MNHDADRPKTKTQADARAERLAAALKSNLRRRKAQARQRASRGDAAPSGRAETPSVAKRDQE